MADESWISEETRQQAVLEPGRQMISREAAAGIVVTAAGDVTQFSSPPLLLSYQQFKSNYLASLCQAEADNNVEKLQLCPSSVVRRSADVLF